MSRSLNDGDPGLGKDIIANALAEANHGKINIAGVRGVLYSEG
jgi:hypothetical protein